METEVMVTVGVRVPVSHYQELVDLAQRRGLLNSKGRVNVSEAARLALADGLRVNRQQAQPAQAEEEG